MISKTKPMGVILLNKICVVLCFLLILCSCQSNKARVPYESEKAGAVPVIYNEAYNTELWLSSETGIKSPAGILCRDNDMIVCDYTGNKLVVLDYDGKPIKTVGKLGYGELEFVEPTGITQWNDEIYVLDAGNSRIQVLNNNLEFDRWIKLAELTFHALDDRYISIAINDNGDIYVTSNTVDEDNVYVKILRGDEVISLNKQVSGYVASFDGKIYADNVYEVFTDEKAESVTGTFANHHLYEITNDKINEVFSFPFKYAPAGFFIEDNSIYTASSCWGRLDRFSLDGKYVETLADFYQKTESEGLSQVSTKLYVAKAPNGDFFVSNTKSGFLYHITQNRKDNADGTN